MQRRNSGRRTGKEQRARAMFDLRDPVCTAYQGWTIVTQRKKFTELAECAVVFQFEIFLRSPCHTPFALREI